MCSNCASFNPEPPSNPGFGIVVTFGLIMVVALFYGVYTLGG